MARQKYSENKVVKLIKSRPRAFIISGLVLVVLVFLLQRISTSNNQTITDARVEVKAAIAQETLGREFTFPLRDGSGEEVSRIKFEIESAELRDEIIVNGKKLGSVKGRTLLVLNLKITNEFNKGIEIDTKDYARLSTNENKDVWLAPDIHNDPVKVQAISTKLTRLAFPIGEKDKNLVLRIGEIQGDKEEIPLSIKY